MKQNHLVEHYNQSPNEKFVNIKKHFRYIHLSMNVFESVFLCFKFTLLSKMNYSGAESLLIAISPTAFAATNSASSFTSNLGW